MFKTQARTHPLEELKLRELGTSVPFFLEKGFSEALPLGEDLFCFSL